MKAALMREGRLADIGGVPVRGPVEALVEQPRDMGQIAHPGRRYPGIEAHLEDERGDERDEIGIAAALAEPVQRALELPHASAHRSERVGDGILGVVVAMDAETL